MKVGLLPQQVEFCTGVATSPLLFVVCVGKVTYYAETVPSPGWRHLDKHLAHNLALPFAQLLCEMLYYILLQ